MLVDIEVHAHTRAHMALAMGLQIQKRRQLHFAAALELKALLLQVAALVLAGPASERLGQTSWQVEEWNCELPPSFLTRQIPSPRLVAAAEVACLRWVTVLCSEVSDADANLPLYCVPQLQLGHVVPQQAGSSCCLEFHEEW